MHQYRKEVGHVLVAGEVVHYAYSRLNLLYDKIGVDGTLTAFQLHYGK